MTYSCRKLSSYPTLLLRAAHRVVPTLLIPYFLALVYMQALATLPNGDLTWDFGSFVASGRAAAEGFDPYGLARAVPGTTRPNLNPPISVLAFRSVAPFDPVAAFRIWYVASLSLYLATVLTLSLVYSAEYPFLRFSWALALTGLWDTLVLGQIYTILLTLTVGVWIALRAHRHVLAGILIGTVAAVKPPLAIWPVLLVLAGHGRIAVASVISALVLSVIPLLVHGPAIYQQWLMVVRTEGFDPWPANASLLAMSARLQVPWLGPPLCLSLFIVLAVRLWYQRPPALHVCGLAITLSLLASPLTWPGYTLLLLPLFFSRPWDLPALLAALLLTIPATVVASVAIESSFHLAIVGSVYTLSLVLVFFAQLRDLDRRWWIASVQTPDQSAKKTSGV